MDEPSVWIVGDWQCTDFSAALEWLNTQVQCTCFDDAATLLAETTSAAPHSNPYAVVLFQSRPGQLAAIDVERLHAAAPLARLIALVGPWCEGEMRSGRPWPGVERVPWNSWRSRLPRALCLSRPDDASVASLPRTASEVERIEKSVLEISRAERVVASALICTASQTTYQSVADALETLGVRSHWQYSLSAAVIPPVDLVVFDGWEQVLSNQELVTGGGPVLPRRLLLLDFPRAGDLGRAAELGMDAILAQPLLLADLSQELSGLDPPSRPGLDALLEFPQY